MTAAGAGQVEEARKLDGLIIPAASAMWSKVAVLQRLGLIRLRWLENKQAQLRFVDPNREVA